jgi:hypothetical protein
MSQRKSDYERRPADLYETPEWVTNVLGEHIDLSGAKVWEPACGSGKMVRALEALGASVFASDLLDQGFAKMAGQFDFVNDDVRALPDRFDHIVSNCPYGPNGSLAVAFIERGLELLPLGGFLALLLQADFDSAGGRRHLFRDCAQFVGRIVLNKRILWFEPPPPKPGEKKPAGPSQNHAWFLWHRSRVKSPIVPFVLYGPQEGGEP